MEFTIVDFVSTVREMMYNQFPYLPNRGKNPSGSFKHKNDNQQIRDVAFKNNPTAFPSENTATFDIGGEYAEMAYPYYHILQDARTIHKRGKGTKSSKGSQAKVEPVSTRDYGRVSWNGKTFTKEYAKNVRGNRYKYNSAQRYVKIGGERLLVNKTADSYVNIHYHYIDRILDNILPYIAQMYGMKMARKQDSGLSEEYAMQQTMDIDNVVDILNSFTEE